jgi:hypothetical protein
LKYSIDTSAFLDGWARYYPPDVFPPVWEKIDKLIDDGILVATEEVLYELEKKDDEMYAWALDREHMFIPIDENIQLALQSMLPQHRQLIDQRKNRSGADPWIIALAIVEKCAVLTGEKPTNSAKRPHIPDVCIAMGVRWINMIQLFREQGWVF